ncbi:MAG: glycosyltransferase family 4 protein [Steroidobacteraceae bacterium]
MSERAPGVLFILNALAIGGAERQVVTLVNHLDTRRFRLHLAYLKRSEALLPQIDANRLDGLFCCDVTSKLSVSAVRRLRRFVAARDIELIVATNLYPTLYGALVRATSARPVALASVFHTTLMPSAKQRFAMSFYRRVIARCDRLLYVCENQRRFWQSRGLRARSDAVVHNGIDTEYFCDVFDADAKRAIRARFGFTAKDYVVGLCAALRPEKAHGDLLHAIAALRERGVPAKGLLIGDGPERAGIERAVVSLGLADHVRITGFQSDVRPFIAACNVMSLVSHAIETFSLAALESMACGKPLAMSDLGGADEQITHGRHGFLYPPGDIPALTECLASLASEERRATMGAAAAARVRRAFTLDRMIAGFEDHFEALVRGGHPAPATMVPPREISPPG